MSKKRHKGWEYRLWINENVYVTPCRKRYFQSTLNKMQKTDAEKLNYAPLLLNMLANLGGIAQLDTLADMFVMYAGHHASSGDFLEALNELKKQSLLSEGYVAQGPQRKLKALPARRLSFVYITAFGKSVLAGMGIRCPMAHTSTSQINAVQVKKNLIATRLLCRMINLDMLTSFGYNASIKRKSGKSGKAKVYKVTPKFLFHIKDNTILYFNYRKSKHWASRLLKELTDCCRVYGKKTPTVLVHSEDFLMNTDIYRIIAAHPNLKANIIFTDDITFLNSTGRQFLYTVTHDSSGFGRKILK